METDAERKTANAVIESSVWKTLKSRGGTASYVELLKEMPFVGMGQLPPVLSRLVASGKLSRTPDGNYRVNFWLNPRGVDKTAAARSFRWEEIQQAKGTVSKSPDEFMCSDFDILPHVDQGGRGTCVGWSGMLIALSQHWALCPQDMPTPEQAAKVGYGIVKVGACDMPVMMFPYPAPSAQQLYLDSREAEGVTVPSGSVTRGVSKVLCSKGWNTEDEVNTSRSDRCAPDYYPFPGTDVATYKATLAKTAAPHKYNGGFATVTTWEGLLDAIYQSNGRVHIPITIWANYTTGGCVGNFPDPKGADDDGSHAMRCVGYSKTKGEVYVIHTWAQWSKKGGFSKRYYDVSAGAAFVPITSEDHAVAVKLYSKVIVKTNCPCNITVNADTFPNTQATSVRVLRGSSVSITAVPVFPLQWQENSKGMLCSSVDTEEQTVELDFTPTAPPSCNIRCQIQKIIRAALDKYFKK